MASVRLTPARFEEMQALFEAVLDQPPESRPGFLAERTTTDPELRAEVDALLAAHARSESWRASPLRPPPEPAKEAERRGHRVGAYQLVRRIGAGGMGTVYEAERVDDEFQRRVAIKFLRRTLAGAPAYRRFQSERQILANLTHGNIAALIDGGTTPEGEPYFVMELVTGEPITTWCDTNRRSVRERLGLFLQVCAAVQAAHQQLIIHRDLKPGNILVAEDGTVKLLDFGIAKLVTPEGSDPEQPATQVGGRVFTPEYAAPEQVRGEPVGTMTDTYALGVLLFELLTGRRPFDFQGKGFIEIERILAVTPPPRPSGLIDEVRAAVIGERSPARARALVRGDLDAVVQMALRKEPERRYGTVEQLARDVRAHLDGQPVTARPDGFGYRFGKLVRRHRLETVAITVAVASLVGGLVAANTQRRRALAQGRRAEQVTQFLTSMLGSADPGSLGKDVTVRQMLDSAAIRADTLRGTPELESEIRTIIGATYIELGEYDAAQQQIELDIAARRRFTPAGSFGLGTSISRLALAHEYAGRLTVADSLLQQSRAMFERFPPPNPEELASVLEDRARVLIGLGRPKEAAPLLMDAIAVQERDGSPNDSSVAFTYANAARAVSDIDQIPLADSLLRLAQAAARRAFGDGHPQVATTMSLQADVFERMGRMSEADSTYRAMIALRRRILGPEHPTYAWGLVNYADHLALTERSAQAAAVSREVLSLRGRTLEDSHPVVGSALGVLGRSLGRLDSLAAAERYLQEALALRRTNFPEGHWIIEAALNALGENQVLAGRYRVAEPILLATERRLVELRGPRSENVRNARRRLVLLYDRLGRPAEARSWQRALDSALAR